MSVLRFGHVGRRTAPLLAVLLALLPVTRGVAAADPITLRIGVTQAASETGLNPFLALLGQDWLMMADVYDLLTEFGPNLEPEPGLATSWDTSPDGLTWTYHIRQGVTWQDGQPLTADDVAFTFNYIRESEDPNYKGPQAPDGNDLSGAEDKGQPPKPDGAADNPLSLFDNYLDLSAGFENTRITSIEATDPSTVVIKTTSPLVVLNQMYIPIVPKHIWEKVTYADAQNFLNKNPIGSGPYQMVDFQPDQVMRLTANKNYWGGAPKIDQIIYQYFDNDQAAVQALKSGSIDMLNTVPTTLASTLKGDPNITVNQAASSDFTELGFNSWDPTPKRFKAEGCGDCTKGPTTGSMGNPWLTKPEVRAALSQLVDKPALVDRALSGYGQPGESLVGPFNPNYNYQPPADDPATYPGDHNAANARFQAVMTGLGFSDTDGDGILNVPDTSDAQAFDPNGAGKNWSLRLFIRDDRSEDKIAGGLIQTWFQDAGVNVDLQQVKESPFLGDATFPSSTNADSDMYLWGWGPDPDPDFILSVFACSQINNWQDANYCDPAYDKLYSQSQTAIDLPTRQQIVHDLQAKLYTDAPYDVLWYSDTLEAYRSDRFTGLVQLPVGQGAVWGAWGYGPYGSRLTVETLDQAAAEASPTPAPQTPAPQTPAAPSQGVPTPPASSGGGGVATAAPTAAPVPTPANTQLAIVATPAPTAAPQNPAPPPASGSDSTPLIVGGIVVVVLVGLALLYWRRRAARDAE